MSTLTENSTCCYGQEEEEKKPPSSHINITVKGQDGMEVPFRVKRSAQLKKLMTAYCDERAVELEFTRFLFDGKRLRGHETPNEREMECGDQIDAMLHQFGAGNVFHQSFWRNCRRRRKSSC